MARGAARGRRRALWLLLLLFVPLPEAQLQPHDGEPFRWSIEPMLQRLESRFDARREAGCADFDPRRPIGRVLAFAPRLRNAAPGADVIDRAATAIFEGAAEFAACPAGAADFVQAFEMLRAAVKDASARWPEARGKASLYRLLYGGRMAVEEVLLQLPEAALPALSRGTDGQSDAPSLMLHGVRVHSGDLLVSRGGAPTSAMIARGNDYPGTFSHVALVVIEDGEFETVEAHIERGVVVAGLERYEDDRKLRILLLRPRADRMGGGAAHRAALWARDEARRRTIAYDFASNLEDPSEMFCSEVAAHAYASEGVELWRERTTTSRVGPATWLSLFGVRRFETYGPSDLEYDPNLTVVAEWRNPDALFEDHVDSAAMDVLLDGADRGDALTFRIWMLPVARLLKAYSSVLNLFHIEGPIPEGMSPQAALRVNELGRRHDAIVAHVEAEAEGYRQREGHRPPYWELLEMARGAGAATL